MTHSFTAMRRPDWSIRWTEFIKDSLDIATDLQIDWDSRGITCASWAGDGIEVLTGENPFDPYIGSFDGIIGACKAIKKAGFNTLDDLVASMFPEVPVSMAQMGDLVLVRTARWDGDHLLVDTFSDDVMPHGIALVDPPLYYAVTDQGLGKGDLYKDGVRAFAVGRLI